MDKAWCWQRQAGGVSFPKPGSFHLLLIFFFKKNALSKISSLIDVGRESGLVQKQTHQSNFTEFFFFHSLELGPARKKNPTLSIHTYSLHGSNPERERKGTHPGSSRITQPRLMPSHICIPLSPCRPFFLACDYSFSIHCIVTGQAGAGRGEGNRSIEYLDSRAVTENTPAHHHGQHGPFSIRHVRWLTPWLARGGGGGDARLVRGREAAL